MPSSRIPYQPTDVANFNTAGVPSLSFTTGAHTDYHKPSDTADKINYEDLERVARMASAIVGRVMDTAQPPAFAKVEQSQQTANRTGLRVFTGTVPDYTAEAKGLLLGGVVGGGPAEQAGLQKGDIIVEIAGQSIANIYDYTYALELLKVGQPASVSYMRNGERRQTTLTPTALTGGRLLLHGAIARRDGFGFAFQHVLGVLAGPARLHRALRPRVGVRHSEDERR